MYDFLRFLPRYLPDLGFKSYVFMLEKPEGCGIIIKADSPEDLRKKLRNVRRKAIVGVVGSEAVCREAVMRRRVDLILDWEERELDYATLKLAAEKDVAIELGLSKFLRTEGYKRMHLFDKLRQEIMIIKKLEVPFIVTTAAENQYELRTRKQVESFFKFFGAEITKARYYAERLVRRYFDDKYIMDGFEVESLLDSE
uniref:Ribonuclease P protein component 3 n=1 Tax=Archaeoglobus fulgidus TaxID=2234 RepID=A0A7C3REP7_ARCFL